MNIDQWNRDDSARLKRVEEKLDALLGALADDGGEEQEAPATNLDGRLVPGERDQSQSLS